MACLLAGSPDATLCIEGFGSIVTSTTAPIATGWSNSCQVGIAPTEERRLSRRTAILDCSGTNDETGTGFTASTARASLRLACPPGKMRVGRLRDAGEAHMR